MLPFFGLNGIMEILHHDFLLVDYFNWRVWFFYFRIFSSILLCSTFFPSWVWSNHFLSGCQIEWLLELTLNLQTLPYKDRLFIKFLYFCELCLWNSISLEFGHRFVDKFSHFRILFVQWLSLMRYATLFGGYRLFVFWRWRCSKMGFLFSTRSPHCLILGLRILNSYLCGSPRKNSCLTYGFATKSQW